MSRDGGIVFGDLVGKLNVLVAEWRGKLRQNLLSACPSWVRIDRLASTDARPL
jgi:hypothetical protein